MVNEFLDTAKVGTNDWRSNSEGLKRDERAGFQTLRRNRENIYTSKKFADLCMCESGKNSNATVGCCGPQNQVAILPALGVGTYGAHLELNRHVFRHLLKGVHQDVQALKRVKSTEKPNA